MPIREVVGGMGVVSNTTSELREESTLLIEGVREIADAGLRALAR